MQRIPRVTYPLLALSLAFVLAACGGDREEPTSTPPPATATSVAATDTPVPATDTPAPVATTAPTAAGSEVTPTVAAGNEVTATAAAESAAYPAPTEVQPAEAAPAAEEGAYPAPSATLDAYPPPVTPTPETSRIPIVPFVLEGPLAVGDTVVRGTGPANVPIVIIDASFMGDILGKGVIGPDGKFAIETLPMEDKHWVGLTVDDLTGTDFAYEDFYAQGFRGPHAEAVPNVAFLYDSLVVGQ
jgi:hypothetical protein